MLTVPGRTLHQAVSIGKWWFWRGGGRSRAARALGGEGGDALLGSGKTLSAARLLTDTWRCCANGTWTHASSSCQHR